MGGRYLIIVTLLAFLLLAAVLAFGFSSISSMSNGGNSKIPIVTKIESYGRMALSKANEFASPLLGTFGISLDGSKATDEVTRHLQEAGSAVNDAVNQITR